MAVPKKRTGHSAQGKRRSNWKASKPATTKCPKCGATVLAHTVCTECGTYKGKVVSRKSPDFVEAAAEVKKPAKKAPAKKTTKKAAKPAAEVVEEVKAEETVVEEKAEEVKTEKKTEE